MCDRLRADAVVAAARLASIRGLGSASAVGLRRSWTTTAVVAQTRLPGTCCRHINSRHATSTAQGQGGEVRRPAQRAEYSTRPAEETLARPAQDRPGAIIGDAVTQHKCRYTKSARYSYYQTGFI